MGSLNRFALLSSSHGLDFAAESSVGHADCGFVGYCINCALATLDCISDIFDQSCSSPLAVTESLNEGFTTSLVA